MDTIETNNLPKTLKHRFTNARKGAKEYIARWFASIIDDIAYEIDQTTKITGKKYVFTEPVAGLSPDLLNLIVDKAIADEYWDDKWLLKGADGHFDEIILAFMDFRKMNRSAFKSRYPNSFHVWAPQDDEDLRTISKCFCFGCPEMLFRGFCFPVRARWCGKVRKTHTEVHGNAVRCVNRPDLHTDLAKRAIFRKFEV